VCHVKRSETVPLCSLRLETSSALGVAIAKRQVWGLNHYRKKCIVCIRTAQSRLPQPSLLVDRVQFQAKRMLTLLNTYLKLMFNAGIN